ncbi:MAG: FlgD immunoglobulin-like domain containing protein [Candidatus Latescibacterota bacterium]
MKQLLAYIFLILQTLPIAAQEEEEEVLPGYEVLSDRVLIETPDHWRVWDAPTGARIIREDGTVIPRLLRSRINAVYSAEDDSVVASSSANSNPQDAALAIDGDETTFWEPDPLDDISKWTFEINLERTLIAERIVVRFADEGEGDPFRQFRVLISDGLAASGRGGEVFSRIGLVRNLSGGREFSFDLTPQRKVAEGIEGAIVQKIRIDVLATEGERAEEIDRFAYSDLGDDDRGEIDYFLQTSSGRLIAVSENTYADLPAEEQGPVRYYRRERPRLSEVEVFALGENIVAITQAEREREALSLGQYDFLLFRTFTDGLFATNKDMQFYDAVQDENQVEIDLGAKYWLDRVKLLSPDRPPFAYQVRISNGSVDANGNFVWTTFDERRNLERFLHVEEKFPRQEVRYIEFRQLEFSGSRFEKGRLSEIQAYGEGYVSEITMESPFIELDRPRLFDRVTWDGEAPPNTRIEVRTRTGEEVTLEPHYFTQNGREISEDLWRRLPDTEQTPRPAPIFEEITGPDWSNWSPAYTQSGEAFKSPAPRPLAKVQVRLISREPLQRAWLRSLRLHFVPPLVDTAFGEIFPVGGVEPGIDEQFTLYLRPIFGPDNPGFDEVVLRSTSSAPLELSEVLVGGDDALRFGSGTRLWPGGDIQIEDGEEGAVIVRFPQPVTRGNQIYAFRFKTRVFLQSTVFSAQLQSASRPGLSQEVVGGDATNVVATQSLSVVSRLENNSLLENVDIAPNVITPNGDGINDQVDIRIAIFHLERAKTLSVEVFSLSGQRVRDLSVRRSFPSGEHLFAWDGRDDNGQVLSPGIYVLRVHFNTDSGTSGTSAAHLVHLAY